MKSTSGTTSPHLATVALASFWLAILNRDTPVLRLTSSYANLVAFWVLLTCSLGLAVVALLGLRGRGSWQMVFGIPSIAFGSTMFLATSVGLLMTDFGAPDAGFAPVQRAPLPHGGELVVYHTNCGATCSIGAVVRQERRILPGVILVRTIYHTSRFRAEDARVQVIDDDHARVDVDIVRLRRWVYL